MAFDLEWTGRSYGDESDRARAIEAANEYCARWGIDPAKVWQDATDKDDWTQWNDIEGVACHALCEGWETLVDNVSLIWT